MSILMLYAGSFSRNNTPAVLHLRVFLTRAAAAEAVDRSDLPAAALPGGMQNRYLKSLLSLRFSALGDLTEQSPLTGSSSCRAPMASSPSRQLLVIKRFFPLSEGKGHWCDSPKCWRANSRSRVSLSPFPRGEETPGTVNCLHS